MISLSSYLSWSFLSSFITLANVMGAIGGLLYIASISMTTVIPLRIAAIGSAFFFLCYGVFAGSFPTIFLYGMLLPLNAYRLHQMIQLIKKVRAAASTDLSVDWLEPFMTKRKYRQGEVVFRKGDSADEMFLVVTGNFLVSEIGVELQPGQVFGEMGLLTTSLQRTQSVECVKAGQLMTITYDKVRELYFQNPEFGFYFLRLIGERLLHNLKRAEQLLADERQKYAVALSGGGAA